MLHDSDDAPPLGWDAIADALQTFATASPLVAAAWLGGSAATDRLDELSDIDSVFVLANDAAPDALFAAVEVMLADLSQIVHRMISPTPTWHGLHQRFYRLREAGPYAIVDLVVAPADSNYQRFLEPHRHGTPRILRDPDGLLVPPPFDPEAHRDLLRQAVADVAASLPITGQLVDKAIRRHDLPEATQWHHAFIVRPLVTLLRIQHCPMRYDFGLRYLSADLPDAARELVEGVVAPSSLIEIDEARELGHSAIEALLQAIHVDAIKLPQARA